MEREYKIDKKSILEGPNPSCGPSRAIVFMITKVYSNDGVVNREKRYRRPRERYKERECNNRRTRENEQVIMTFGGKKFFR